MGLDFQALAGDAQALIASAWNDSNVAFNSFVAENIDTSTFLAAEPLVTINAVGVAMSLFALEQRLAQNRQLRSRVSAKRNKLSRRIMDLTFYSGFLHMASILWVLAGRSGCVETCPSAVVQEKLAIATNYTLVGIGVLLVGIIFLMLDVFGATVRHRDPPSLMGPDPASS